MLTIDQIVQNIINQLRLLDPTVSAEIGTPERKLIEAVAELIASQQVDFSVLANQQDLGSLSGGRLDAYLSIFNFGRQQATPSYGTVTFSSNTPAATAIVIPRGTQVLANTNDAVLPTLTFVTTQAAVLEVGATSVEVTIQCATAGTISNVAANAITSFAGLQTIIGITKVANNSALSGGTDQESDSEYKVRFQNTLFRNMAGTYDQFMALALAMNSVTKANVVGPISRYQEYLQIPSADDVAQRTITGGYDDAGTTWPHKRTTAESTIPYSKYTYPVNYYLTDGSLDPATATWFRAGVDFVFNAPPETAGSGTTHIVDSANSTKPNVTFLATAANGGNAKLVNAAVVLLEHAYMSKNSRNDIPSGVLNALDVFVNGGNPQTVSSQEVVPTNANNLQSSTTTTWTYQNTSPVVVNFRRILDGKAAAVGSRISPLYWQPVLDLPDQLQVGTATYYKANFWNPGDSTYYNQYDGVNYTLKAHYIMVEERNANFGTVRARNGIEWFLAGNNYLNGQLPSDSSTVYTGPKIDAVAGTAFLVDGYTYDQNVSDLQAIMEKNKQDTQDVLVHRSKVRYFQPIVSIMYTLGSTQAVVNASIIAALSTFFDNQYFGSAIQLSDILQTIHNVPGVDNVRWTNPDTGQNKVQEVNPDGSPFASGAVYFTTDFYIQDNELPATPSASQIVITVRAQNTWG
jgi:uncharacterized phage protein gp47/JayE